MANSRAQKKSAKTSPGPRRVRYKNEAFLKVLGEHCKQMRVQRGYSIDRLARESDQLSPATIDRLERGLADSQILVLTRYAEVLGANLLDLFSFLKDAPDLSKDSRIIPYHEGAKPPAGYVPVYPLKIAAGKFSDENDFSDVTPIGWAEASVRSGVQDYFASFVHGQSMEPQIKDGSLCLFRRYSGGSRQGKIYLIQAQGIKNSETGESFVIKKYQRQTAARSSNSDTPAVIHLISENPRFSPIVLVGMQDEEIQTIAEFVKVL